MLPEYVLLALDDEMEGCLTLVALQLVLDTLVAVVEILRMLELLYRVNAEVDVPALEVVLIELRQFPDTIELALEATGPRPLLVLLGEIARWEGRSGGRPRLVCDLEVRDRPGDLLALWPGLGENSLGLRPLLQVEEASSDL